MLSFRYLYCVQFKFGIKRSLLIFTWRRAKSDLLEETGHGNIKMATLEAMLAPKTFAAKGKDPEQLLIDFDLYIKTVDNYLLAVEKDEGG